jgi:hypothetical protein
MNEKLNVKENKNKTSVVEEIAWGVLAAIIQ